MAVRVGWSGRVPVDLKALLEPSRAALLMMECQEGIVGERAALGALGNAVRRHGTIGHVARVLHAARTAKSPVFHCTMGRREDGGGAVVNCRLLAATKKSPGPGLLPGSPQWAPVKELAPVATDYVLTRFHGISPFHGTELDQLLRNLGIRTVVATGVSVNVGVLAMTIEAVNAGYQVVIPREAVAGTPDEYVGAVLDNTLRLLATIAPVDDVLAAWTA
jgi:nicotinamidase-related amidase